MLKKLFISLLILSALTSEGTAVAAYLAAAGLYASGGSGLYSHEETPGEPLGNPGSEAGPQYSVTYRGAFVVPMEEIVRVRADHGMSPLNSEFHVLFAAADAFEQAEFAADAYPLSGLVCPRIKVLASSDSSPPVC